MAPALLILRLMERIISTSSCAGSMLVARFCQALKPGFWVIPSMSLLTHTLGWLRRVLNVECQRGQCTQNFMLFTKSATSCEGHPFLPHTVWTLQSIAAAWTRTSWVNAQWSQGGCPQGPSEGERCRGICVTYGSYGPVIDGAKGCWKGVSWAEGMVIIVYKRCVYVLVFSRAIVQYVRCNFTMMLWALCMYIYANMRYIRWSI